MKTSHTIPEALGAGRGVEEDTERHVGSKE